MTAEREPASRLHSAPEPPLYRITVVAKVGSEASYILEWIEFHRLQGVDKFVLFLDDSPFLQNRQVSTLRLLAAYYSQIGLPDLIDLRTSADLIQDQLSNILEFDDPPRTRAAPFEHSTTDEASPPTDTSLETATVAPLTEAKWSSAPKYPLRNQLVNFHRLGQQTLLKQAWAQYSHLTEWFVHIDVDEFLFSSEHKSLSEYLESLYTMGDQPAGREPDRDIGLLYQNGDLSGIYLHSRNFGLSDSYWFTHTVTLSQNPVTGVIDLHYTPLVPAMTSETSESRLADMIHNLTDYVKGGGFEDRVAAEEPHDAPRALDLFRQVFEQEHRAEADRALPEALLSYPFQIERQVHRAPAIQDSDTLTILKKLVDIWPECEAARADITSNWSQYKKIINDKTRMRSVFKAKNLPGWCAPGHMPIGITSMGKSLIWTGRRYDAPPTYDHIDRVRELDWLKNGVPSGEALATGKEPAYCVVPWVHGCAHAPTSPFLMSKILTLDHHMFRSLESRTIADVAWRSVNGWGKFATKNETKFTLLKFTNLFYSPDTRDRFLDDVKEAFYKIHRPRRAAESIWFTQSQLHRTVDTGNCTDIPSCFQSPMK